MVDEVWVRRPWKQFQREFFRLELEKIEAELHLAEKRFQSTEVQARHADLLQRLTRAEAALRTAEYRKSADDLEDLELQLSETAQELQFTRSESDEAYYEYKAALHEGKRAEKLREQLEELERKKDVLAGRIDLLQKRRPEAGMRVREFTQRVEVLRDTLTGLRADLIALRKQQEVVRRRRIEVKQIVLPQFDSDNFGGSIGRVERCTTCHLGVELAGFENERQPFTRHSYLIEYHPVETFGCTPCHGGQGVALTVGAAHGDVEFWSNPLLGDGIRERLCGTCHKEGTEFREAPTLSDGRKLFETSGCLGCHNVEGYVRIPNIGPPLNHIAAKVRPEWLRKWILNPTGYLPNTKMPNFRFSDEEALAIRAYLFEQSKSKPPQQRITVRNYRADLIESGRMLFSYARCVSCHSLDGVGGTLAPDLARIGEKVRLEWLFDFLKNPRAYQPNTKMPQYRFTDQQILQVVAYLNSLSGPVKADEQELVVYSRDDVRRGEKLVYEYGCLGCHDPVGQEAVGGKVGADLTFFGDKPIENFDFGDELDIARTREAWVVAKLEDPRRFSTERIQLKMPDFGFKKNYAVALSTVLLGFTEEHPPDRLVRRRQGESEYVPPGEFGRVVSELNCFTCHTINGRGGTLAPDLSYEGSRANADWLREFLRNPTTIRPTLTVRMPKFNLPEKEIEILVSYMKTVLINNDVPTGLFVGAATSEEEVELGRKLYHEVYQCQTCHQINYEGGTMGPELVSSDSNIRERRTPGWIFAWMKNPKALDPTTVEVNLGLSDEEAALITKFLLSY